MKIIIGIGFYTIWFTPVIFVMSLLGAIKGIKEGKEIEKYEILCSVSLMLIVIPVYIIAILPHHLVRLSLKMRIN